MALAAKTPQSAIEADQFAALDLGSNSFHLIVASHRGGRVLVIDKLKEMVRLADGLNDRGQLAPEAAERALECLRRFGQRLHQLPSNHVRVVGTSTLRRAKNSGDFLRAAEAALGHQIETISGVEEARLIYLGVAHDLDATDERRLVIDIGGGSTELIVGHRYETEVVNSLHMGCVNMTQRYFKSGKLTRGSFDKAIAFAQQELEPVLTQYQNAGWDRAIGASGTILATGSVIAQLPDHNQAEPHAITLPDLEAVIERLIAIESNAAINLAGLNQDRAPVFVGGISILTGLLRNLDIQSLSTSQGALREGVLFDLLGRQDRQDVRDQTISNLTTRFHLDELQADRVRLLALDLLAQVGKAWNLTEDQDARKLGWAAQVHEIGLSLAHSAYHKHGYYLIANMDLPGFSQAEQTGLALLVRAHRRKFPKEEFDSNSPRSLRLIRLAVLLRLAAVMHRARTGQLPKRLQLKADDRKLKLSLDRRWLDAHPLTRLDLEQEADYLATAGYELKLQLA
ncbi:MAG: exopolyphosphatase [Pseudomonadota bacterium]